MGDKITGVFVDIPTVIREAKQGKWISVKERLPEEDRPVLGWDGVHHYESRLMQHEKDINSPYELKFYIQDSNSPFMTEPIFEITHWTELPAPPKQA